MNTSLKAFLLSIIFIYNILTFILSTELYSDTLYVDGLTRTYLIRLPEKYNNSEQHPLIFVLHGGGGKGAGMNKLTRFNKIADKNNFIVCYPDGLEKHWNDGREDEKYKVNGKFVNDVKFISELIDTLLKRYNIDSTRIYSCGISNGGMMSFRLACELSGRIAAIASVGSSMAVDQLKFCNPQRKIPVMIIFGDEDPLVPFEGGEIKVFGSKRGTVIPVQKSVEYWLKNNDCNNNPEEYFQDNFDDGTSLQKEIYLCGDVSEVQYWLIKGGGHTWPGGKQYLPEFIIGKTSEEFNASNEIWNFFKKFSLADK